MHKMPGHVRHRAAAEPQTVTRVLRASVAVSSLAVAGCWMVSSARNVVVEGRVVTSEGIPIKGATLYYVDGEGFFEQR